MAMNANSLCFDDLPPIEEPVRVYGKSYILREASEGDACAWRNANINAARYQDGKMVGFQALADAEPLLVSLCLYIPDEDGKLKLDRRGFPDAASRVSILTIKSWPSKYVKPIFERAKAISGLEEKESKEVLQKRIKEDQEKLAALTVHEDNGHVEEDPVGNSPEGTTSTSSTA